MSKSFIDNDLDFTLQQMMAEGYWQDYFNNVKSGYYKNLNDGGIQQQKDFILNARYGNTKTRTDINGNTIDPTKTPNTTKITNEQANYLYANYDMVDYKDSDASGFSAMLLKNKSTGEYTWSIRSTEFVEDQARDGVGGADTAVITSGFSLAQIGFMNNYYNQLKSNGTIPAGTKINMTGYSLGSELAQAF